MSAPRPIAISMGDPSGVGPELIAQAFRLRPHWSSRCVVVADLAVMRRATALTGGLLPLAPLEHWQQAAALPPRCLPLLALPPMAELPPLGQISAAAGRAAHAAIEFATQAVLQGQAAALVTAPIHKGAWHAAGIGYPGHTELLQALAAAHLGLRSDQVPVRMMLSNAELHTVLVSIHLPLRAAIECVTQAQVLQTLQLTHRHFSHVLGRPHCRIAVAGLNPHAGEGGLFGREEIEHIAPAIEAARAAGIAAHGPFAPDTVFMRARRGEFDVVLAMYHDQGLIPVKYLGLEQGVNTTLGLPFVRTSPDHGTAFDLAGSGRADPSSFMAALEAALQAVSN